VYLIPLIDYIKIQYDFLLLQGAGCSFWVDDREPEPELEPLDTDISD
jgi:hypothetical protein